MIRNIVFDMGNVLIDYQPMKYTRRFFPDPSEAAQVCTELFGGPEWPLLDQGIIEPQAALRQICERLPDSLRARTEELFCHWFDQLTIIPETNPLGKQMKNNGYRLYILSNAASSFYQYCSCIPIFPLLDGCIVSADEKLVKPDPAIFQLLCERYHLIPEECFFIDDRLENIEAASNLGMAVHQYQMDADALQNALRKAGVSLK